MKRLFLLLALCFLIFTTNAQVISLQLVSSVGDSYKNITYQLDWSIGELQTEIYTTSGQLLTQGFHQGNYTITAIEQSKQFQFEVIVYPNPTTDFVNLKTSNSGTGTLQYHITDLNGRVLQNEKIKGNIQQINFSNFAVGTYIMTIQLNNQFVKSFKIVKN